MAELPPRHVDAETRRAEDVAWREKMRKEDLAERALGRADRENQRVQDLVWRERVRAEDVAWRELVRASDREERYAYHAQTLQCLARGMAFLAAVQNAKPDTPVKELARKAQDYVQWMSEVLGPADQGP
jgi:hypothetical protein